MAVHVDFGAFDADNHYYEAEDAFTRHLDPSMAKRCMQWAHINGRKRLLVAGRINRFIPNPTWDPIARPGTLDDYFRGRNTAGQDVKTMFGELDPLREHPEYQQRDARLAVMDQQGLIGAFFFPTLAVGMQQSLRHDIGAIHAAFHAFNQWLEEDWGFAHQQRIFAAPGDLTGRSRAGGGRGGMGARPRSQDRGDGAGTGAHRRWRQPLPWYGAVRPGVVPARRGRHHGGHPWR